MTVIQAEAEAQGLSVKYAHLTDKDGHWYVLRNFCGTFLLLNCAGLRQFRGAHRWPSTVCLIRPRAHGLSNRTPEAIQKA